MKKEKKKIITIRDAAIKQGEKDFAKYISDQVNELDELKKDLELKKEIFELIKRKENEKVEIKLKENPELKSYFHQFSFTHQEGGEVPLIIYSKNKLYNNYDENKFPYQILKDFKELKKEIDEKEIRFEQRLDLIANEKSRKKVENFTFILALGVIITSTFYLYKFLMDMFSPNNAWGLITSGIFAILLVMLILFVFMTFKMWEETVKFFKKQGITIIISILIILALIWLMFSIPNIDMGDNSLETSIDNLRNIIKNQTITINNPIYLDSELINNVTRPTIHLNPPN